MINLATDSGWNFIQAKLNRQSLTRALRFRNYEVGTLANVDFPLRSSITAWLCPSIPICRTGIDVLFAEPGYGKSSGAALAVNSLPPDIPCLYIPQFDERGSRKSFHLAILTTYGPGWFQVLVDIGREKGCVHIIIDGADGDELSEMDDALVRFMKSKIGTHNLPVRILILSQSRPISDKLATMNRLEKIAPLQAATTVPPEQDMRMYADQWCSERKVSWDPNRFAWTRSQLITMAEKFGVTDADIRLPQWVSTPIRAREELRIGADTRPGCV